MISVESIIKYAIIFLSLCINIILACISRKHSKNVDEETFKLLLLDSIKAAVVMTEGIGLVGPEVKKSYCISLLSNYFKVWDRKIEDYMVFIDSEIEKLIDFSKEVN